MCRAHGPSSSRICEQEQKSPSNELSCDYTVGTRTTTHKNSSTLHQRLLRAPITSLLPTTRKRQNQFMGTDFYLSSSNGGTPASGLFRLWKTPNFSLFLRIAVLLKDGLETIGASSAGYKQKKKVLFLFSFCTLMDPPFRHVAVELSLRTILELPVDCCCCGSLSNRCCRFRCLHRSWSHCLFVFVDIVVVFVLVILSTVAQKSRGKVPRTKK